MAALTNLGFETAGASPGLAASWAVSFVSSVERLDVFADGGVTDGFENGWGADGFATVLVVGTNAAEKQFTNPVGPTPLFAETFEVGWSNNQHFTVEVVGVEAQFVTGFFTGPEGFEGWSTLELDFGSTVSAGVDGFESGWGNDAFETAIVVGTNATANVWAGARSLSAENFENVKTDHAIVISTVDGTIAYTAHGFGGGGSCQVYNLTGLLPAGIVDATKYDLVVDTANSLELHLNGLVQVPTDSGSGVTFLTEPYEYWTVLLPF